MGIWHVFCPVCGGPPERFRDAHQDLLPDDGSPRTLARVRSVTRAIRGADPWVGRWVGVDSDERVRRLGEYSGSGAFFLADGRSELWLPNGQPAEELAGMMRPGDCLGVACHTRCRTLLRRELGYALRFADVWPLVQSGARRRGPAALDSGYGGIRRYWRQFFDFRAAGLRGAASPRPRMPARRRCRSRALPRRREHW
jgi:hypothetical protein